MKINVISMTAVVYRLLLVAGCAVFCLPASAQPGKVKANGLVIHYESFGAKDREPILLIAGTGVQLTGWPEELCEELVNRGYRVIRYDNRDVGLSTKLNAAGAPDWGAIAQALKEGKPAQLPYTLDDMTEDAVGLLDALGLKKAHIVGASMGGEIALRVASYYPDYTLSLTAMMATDGSPGLPMPAKPEKMAALPPPDPAGDKNAFIEREVKVLQAIGSPNYPTDEQTLRQRITREVKRAYDPGGLARQQAASLAAFYQDKREMFRTIKAPTVVVHGAEDPLVPVEAGRSVAATVPGAELRIIPGMGHDVPVALTKTFADAITAAAERASGSKGGR